MKILVVKTLSGIKPAYDSDKEIFNKMPFNEVFEIEYKKKRNVKFHRKFFALLNLAFQNQEAYKSIETMRKDIIKHAGYYEERINAITGEVTEEVKSISFSNMDETEFNKLYNDCKNVISNWLGVDNQQIDEEIEQYY